jgi:hypothetical protein
MNHLDTLIHLSAMGVHLITVDHLTNMTQLATGNYLASVSHLVAMDVNHHLRLKNKKQL